jgi:amidase
MGALADLVRIGLELPIAAYEAARAEIVGWKGKLAGIFRATPVILSPAATGPAPAGLGSTGDPRMNAPWTALGMPAISIPLPVREGLPLGLQLTAAHRQDGRLLRAAVRVEGILNGN